MKFIVNDRTIKADGETIISYNLDYMAEFEFDPEWSDKIITARFVLTNGNYYDVILEDNKCQIPLFKKGLVALGVYTDEFTSTYVTLSVHSSIKDLGNNEVIPPSEDVYQQIIRMIEEGKIKGDPGEPGKDGSDYIITESDYQAIADRVPQPDLTEYVKTLKALIKLNEGQTYDVYESESEDYSKAIPSGSHYASLDMVGGKSVVMNQLNTRQAYNPSSASVYGISRSLTADKGVRVTGTCSQTANFTCTEQIKFKGGHKFLVGLGNSSLPVGCVVQIASQKGSNVYLYTPASDTALSFEVYIPIDTVCDFVLYPFVVDLTQMFGAGNEPTSVDDARIKMIEQYAEEHPQYNEGEIISSEVDAVAVAKADIIRAIPTNFPTLRSAGNVYDYIDLNEGELHRRVGVVDLGELDWGGGSSQNYIFSTKSLKGGYNGAKILCSKYTDNGYGSTSYMADKSAQLRVDYLFIKDESYPTATEFAKAMSGVMLHYELAEEIIEPIAIPTDLTEWLEVEPNGSITFVNDGKLLVPNTERFVRKLNEVQ